MEITEHLEYPLPVLNVNAEALAMEAVGEASAEARFMLKNTGGGTLAGRMVSPSPHLAFAPAQWEGNRCEVRCTFSPAEDCKPGEVLETHAMVLSNGGERRLPVTVKFAEMALSAPAGKEDALLANLQDFYAYAGRFPAEARKLFGENGFQRLLRATDYAYLDAYELLVQEPNRARAMDNFFILSGLKEKTTLIVPQPVVEHQRRLGENALVQGRFTVQKSSAGYFEAEIVPAYKAPWLSLHQPRLTDADFDDAHCAMVQYSINPQRVSGRYAQERLRIGEAQVDIVFKRPAPFRVWLAREGYRFQDEGAVMVENQSLEPLTVEVACAENFVRFAEQQYRVPGQQAIPFIIKLSPLQSAQMLFRKQPSLSATIDVTVGVKGQQHKKTLPLTAGEW